MFGSIIGGPPPAPPDGRLTSHEMGQVLDSWAGELPLKLKPAPMRVPPPLPLAAYLVMVRGE
jgi:hypothetical protein